MVGYKGVDRDTLILKAYNINFLFVLASYVTNAENENTRIRIRKKFRADMLSVFNEKYDFFHVTPSYDVPSFVRNHFEDYLGKMYHSEGEEFIWFAFKKHTITIDDLKKRLSDEAIVEPVSLKNN